MDWNALLQLLADDIGPLAAIVIGGLGYVAIKLWNWGVGIQSERINDHKEHTKEIIETVNMVNALMGAWKDQNRD